jgi:predicted DNA-binding protein
MAVIMAKTERLQIRISPDMKSELQKLAEADGRTVSNYIEQLIKNAIEQKK